jgi:hypothetical protein
MKVGTAPAWRALKMQVEEITIRVDPEAANAYRTASEDERRKLDLLLTLRLKEATRPGSSLKQVIRDISRKAQERGLTPEILKSLLDEQ